jgi:oxygen-independent coproporphyrinogen-3 oxidase
LNPKPNQGQTGGIYVHIPFCTSKCPYCDFYSIADTSLKQRFVSALIREMHMTCDVPFECDTLYMGGGTPSVLEPKFITQIIDTAGSLYQLLPDSEVTLEINPGTVNSEKIREYKSAGVNRISIGVQSFGNNHLNFLGRIHTAEDADSAIQLTKNAGFENVGIDLIYGIPGQTRQSWLSDLSKAVSYEPQHLSCYMLTYEPGTPIKQGLQKGSFKKMSGRLLGDLFKTTAEFLTGEGYFHYEIANFAYAKNLRSRHNQKYWIFSPYIGLGPSSHSFTQPRRYWNKVGVEQYSKDIEEERLPIDGQEVLSREQMMMESIFLGLRQSEGINLSEFNRRFGEDFFTMFGKQIDDFAAKGYMVTTQKSCALTIKGMLFLDSIASKLMASSQG